MRKSVRIWKTVRKTVSGASPAPHMPFFSSFIVFSPCTLFSFPRAPGPPPEVTGGWGGCQGGLTTEPEDMGQEP